MEMTDVVAQRLSDERARSAAIALSARDTDASPEGRARRFFPEPHANSSGGVTNLPGGVTLRDYLVYGQPVVLDLHPQTPQEFEAEHLLRVDFVRALADANLVFPNLYVRRAESWMDAHGMRPLVDAAIAAGERVDTLMATFGDYEGTVDRHATTLQRALEASSPRELKYLLRLEGRSGIDRFAFRHARRWAYLDMLDGAAAADANALVEAGQLRKHLSYVSLASNHIAGSITSSMGGAFVFGPTDKRAVPRTPPAHLCGVNHPEAIKYLLWELAEIGPFEPLSAHGEARLLKFLLNPEHVGLRNRLPGALADLWAAARKDALTEPMARDYALMVREYRKMLRKMGLVGDIARKIGPSFLAHGVAWGDMMTAGGKAIDMVTPSTETLVRRMISTLGPRYSKHRAVTYADRLRDL